MSDDIDRMLQGDDTSSASQAQTGQQDDTKQVVQQTEEEVAFNSLSGSAQDRIRELVKRARDAEEKVPYNPPPQPQLDVNQQQALQMLSNAGVTTDEKLKQEVTGVKNEILGELQKQRLMQQYDGSNGLPKYDPNDVEDYVSRHPEYAQTPRELVFKAVMYPDEFSAGTQPKLQKQGTSFKPVKAQQRQDALTPDFIEERLKQPDGDTWYDEHKDEINKVVYNHTMQFKGANFGQ